MFYGLGFAQDNKVTGNILDGEFNNEPLVFAKVSVKNSSQNDNDLQVVNSDLHGKFALNLPSGTYTFVYEFIGYEPVEIKNVIINKENNALNEVVLSAKKITFENNIASKG